nr:right-handed parallel beta-helix repeat-containing protein [Deltaproteobacteria bacterium]
MDTKTIYRIVTILGLTAVIAFAFGGIGTSVSAKRPPVTEVYPTGVYPDDLIAIQNAVDANPGGKVVLKATTEEGVPCAFNLGDDTTGRGIVQITNAVTIEGKKGHPHNVTLPNGKILDKVKLPVVYGGGAKGLTWPPVGPIPAEEVVGSFHIAAPDDFVTVKDTLFYGSGFTAVSIAACNGVMISGNEVFNPVPKPIFPGWEPFYWGITVSEGWSLLGIPGCALSGTITIEKNNIQLEKIDDRWGIGISVMELQSENVDFRIIGNRLQNPCQWGRGILMEGFPNSTALIKENTVSGPPDQAVTIGAGATTGIPAGTFELINNRLDGGGVCIRIWRVKDSTIRGNTCNGIGQTPETEAKAIDIDQGCENIVVEKNKITIEGVEGCKVFGIHIWGEGCHNNTIKQNTIKGSVEVGIELSGAHHDNMFIANDLKHLEVTEAHVYLDSDTYNNVFVKNKPKVKDMIIIDEGVNNRIDDKGKAAPALLKEFAFAALSAYPQPCNPDTWIPYTLAKDVEVAIAIYSSS